MNELSNTSEKEISKTIVLAIIIKNIFSCIFRSCLNLLIIENNFFVV